MVPPDPDNVVPVSVSAGLSGKAKNRLETSVTLCKPGTSQCATIDHIVIDTGAVGLRLMTSPQIDALGLVGVHSDSGLPLASCILYADYTSMWGSVRRADVRMGRLTAPSLPIQIVNDLSKRNPCHGKPYLSISGEGGLHANGIIGIDLLMEDCGATCAKSAAASHYFECNSDSDFCKRVAIPKSAQLQNPVRRFPKDNNGIVITLPLSAVTNPDGLWCRGGQDA